MKFLNILVLAMKKRCKILWVPIMPGTQILWVIGTQILWVKVLPFGRTCYISVLTELASLQTSQADVCKGTSLVYEPGATKLSFFLQQWPQEGAFSLTGCNM
jgi:uncharacterized protein YqgC (DUF456 family)